MKLNKTAAILTFYSILGFFANGTGFDFYAHSTAYYYFNQNLSHAYIAFDSVVVPRYLLLSTIYEVSSRLGIPIGFITTLLIIHPAYLTFKETVNKSLSRTYNLIQIIIILITFSLVANYSAMFLALLYIIALLTTRRKYLIIGIFFHPVAFLIGILMIFFHQRYLISTFLKTTFIIFLFFTSQQKITC